MKNTLPSLRCAAFSACILALYLSLHFPDGASAQAWTEERQRAVTPEMLWTRQREALRNNSNPYEMDLAVEFLRLHQGKAVIVEELGRLSDERRRSIEMRQAVSMSRSVCR
jgi:hypothetical protein